MRFLFLCLLTVFLIGCDTASKSDQGNAGVTMPPEGLEGPAYDPSTSPQPVGQMTMPAPAPATPPVQYGSTPAPTQGNETPMNPGTQQPKGDVAQGPATYGNQPTAPQTYNAPAPAPATAPQTYNAPTAPQTYSAPIPATPAAALAQQVIGKWVNGTDEREMVAFTDDHYETYYDGELLVQEPMTYFADCPGDCSGGTPLGISCFTISGPAGKDCYGIVRMTADVLELSLLGVSTETITYYRMQ